MGKHVTAKVITALFAAFPLLYAAPADSTVAVPKDSAVVSADSLKKSEELLSAMQASPSQDSVVADSAAVPAAVPADSVAAPAAVPADSAAVPAAAPSDSALAKSDAVDTTPTEVKTKKSVLYLGGGEHSAWYHLGVLYAIETYELPVDSIVGASWGAYVGFLWAKGVSLDDIQRILLDSYMVDAVGHNEFDDLYKRSEREFNLPLTADGIPSLRHRFTISSDSSGNLYHHAKSLEPDSQFVKRSLSRLRLQESLLRQPAEFVIPFTVEGDVDESKTVAENVFRSLPLLENTSSGELTPFLVVPSEEVQGQLAVISVASPVTVSESNGTWNSPWQNALAQKELQNLSSQPGVVVRAHTVRDTSRNAWIQAGFSALERRLGELMELRPRKVDYASQKRSVLPWFRFNPVFDSLSAELHSAVKTYWNPEDTGMVAPEKFAYDLIQNPVYDSVNLEMLPSGELMVDASVKPTFDVYAGGFGSNAIGPNAYGGVDMHYANQMEFEASLSGFWGGKSYGFTPSLRISRLWKKNWSFFVGYDWQKIETLESYGNDAPSYSRIYAEKRRDINVSIAYQLNELQKLSVNFLIGNRTFDLSPIYYGDDLETKPISPSLSYEFVSGDGSQWFSQKGIAISANMGLQSIGFDFGRNDVIPIYYTGEFEARYSGSPRPYMTFGAAIGGGISAYHDDGNGYVYPKSFDYKALDNCYRHHVRATPWSSEWYNVDLASHHFGLVRLNAGLHYHGSGLWLYGAYVRDYEENSMALLNKDKFVLEPAFRLSFKSLMAYFGISQMVDNDNLGDLKKFDDYKFFVRVGNYELF
ncbi:patatin-like phospholipase family protein [Fibrobacter sp.]|uniref:patatin-like phospholipase family protein n=1 Tax=Fibrobacter sp. TaxID=35828 RepID=UPI00388EA6B9